jgi:hypothetical protein
VVKTAYLDDHHKKLSLLPKGKSLAVLTRAALRVLPVLLSEFEKHKTPDLIVSHTVVLPCFTSLARAYAAILNPNDFMELSDAAAIYSREIVCLDADVNYLCNALGQIDYTLAIDALVKNHGDEDASYSADSSVSVIGYLCDAWSETEDDHTHTLEKSINNDIDLIDMSHGAQELIRLPLWNSIPSSEALPKWAALSTKLISLDEDWGVWVRWYNAVLMSSPTPGGRKLDLYRATLSNDDGWEKGPSHVNALIKARENVVAVHANFEGTASIKFDATATLLSSPPKIPNEILGQSWTTDSQTGMLTPVFRHSDQTEPEITDMEIQRPFLFECAQSLVTAISTSRSNSVGQLLRAAERYLRSIENNSSLISIPEVYAAGVRLRNSHDRIRREVENEGMPDVTVDIGEAMDSVIGLHGPFILATARGREMNARARDDNRTKTQELAYKAKSLEFAEALKKSNGLVNDSGKNFIVEINSEILTGPHPERSTMLAEASNHNLLVTASSVIAVEYSKAVLVDTVAGNAAIGIGTNNANIAINWMIANASLLSSLAATSPETLYWLPHFLRWLQAWYDTSRN